MNRYLLPLIKELCIGSHKMGFISGARQVGKTTLVKSLKNDSNNFQYHTWEDLDFRRTWIKNPKSFIPSDSKKEVLLALDEIHKAKGWKNTLKGIYDLSEPNLDILVTGSARLNVFKRGSDSLLGRYFNFRLHPLSVGELSNGISPTPDEFQTNINELESSSSVTETVDALKNIYAFGGFPEPFFKQSKRHLTLWQRSRIEKLVREDLRDLSRIQELSQIEMLCSLMPERVGSLFSRNSVREILEVSHTSIRAWLTYLEELYYFFEIKPYQRKIARSLKKEGKIYLWDLSEVKDEGARFENLIALHLLKACHYWSDAGYGDFSLQFVRNKDKEEIDFLIIRDKKPWFACEAKFSETEPQKAWSRMMPHLGLTKGFQVVFKENIRKTYKYSWGNVEVVSADQLLKFLP